MKYEWLLFDLDNTLLDFNVSEHYALTKVLQSVDITFNESVLKVYEKINRQCWDDFEAGKLPQAAINETRFSQFLAALNLPNKNATQLGDYYLEQLSEKSIFMDGGKELLEEQANKYHLGIITNGLKQVQRPKLIKSQLVDYFKVIVVSDEIGISKPQSAIFEHAFEKMNFPAKEKVLMIGDSLSSDIQGGINYGIDTCWYNFKEQENQSNIKPTYTINHLAELKTLEII